MHFLTSLLILIGLLAVLGVGLVSVIQNLSEMSMHAAPRLSPTPHRPAGGVEEAPVNTTAVYESNPADASEVE